MSDEPIDIARAVARFAPAEDVTDLDMARRMITALRQQIEHMVEEAEPVDGEWTAFLDAEHDRMLQLLYEKQRLFTWREPGDSYWVDPPELVEAFTEFVEGFLDIAWDMARDEQDLSSPKSNLITPSA